VHLEDLFAVLSWLDGRHPDFPGFRAGRPGRVSGPDVGSEPESTQCLPIGKTLNAQCDRMGRVPEMPSLTRFFV